MMLRRPSWILAVILIFFFFASHIIYLERLKQTAYEEKLITLNILRNYCNWWLAVLSHVFISHHQNCFQWSNSFKYQNNNMLFGMDNVHMFINNFYSLISIKMCLCIFEKIVGNWECFGFPNFTWFFKGHNSAIFQYIFINFTYFM